MRSDTCSSCATLYGPRWQVGSASARTPAGAKPLSLEAGRHTVECRRAALALAGSGATTEAQWASSSFLRTNAAGSAAFAAFKIPVLGPREEDQHECVLIMTQRSLSGAAIRLDSAFVMHLVKHQGTMLNCILQFSLD